MSDDDRDNLWVGTDRGLALRDGDGWQVFTSRDGLSHDEIHGQLVDTQGQLWAGTRHSLSRREGGAWQVLTTENGAAGQQVCALLEHRRGRIWVAAGAGGIYVRDGQ